jgi:hypothetical protein
MHWFADPDFPAERFMETWRFRRDIRELLDEYPELSEPDVLRLILATAEQLSKHIGVPQLADDPRMWRLAYLAGRAMGELGDE